MENKIFDTIIIGAGPAGMTAAIYVGRAGKSVAIVDKDGFGGNIAKSPKVENIPGFLSISGIDFASNMYEQITALETVEHVIGEVVSLDYKHGLILITLADRNVLCCQSLIIATGASLKLLPLATKNQYSCVTCDGPFFKNKNVFVVGSGNSGAAYALELANYCKNVYLCDISSKMLCEPATIKKIEKNNKIHWLPNCTITDTKNDKDGNLSTVILNTKEIIKVSAIFTAIGMKPDANFAKRFVNFDTEGYIISSAVPGVFIAGDCRSGSIKQVVTACSDGVKAALNAINFLSK